MFVIAGLGNPEKKYDNTRHNTGFEVIDYLAGKTGIELKKHEHKAITGSGIIDGQKVLLVKPLTYMNLSGESIVPIIDYYGVDEKTELLVIYDDVSLPQGQLRIRKKGSAGGHNGIKDIIFNLAGDEFWRIKVGVGAPSGQKNMVAHVLGHFSKDEREIMDKAIKEAADAALMFTQGKTDEAMNLYNRKKVEEDPEKDNESI